MIYAALLIGAFLGACGVAALLLVLRIWPEIAAGEFLVDLADLPPIRRPPTPMPQCKEGRKPCIGCYGGDLPCVCKHATDWDVAIASERKHENTVRYEFLGMTWHEEE